MDEIYTHVDVNHNQSHVKRGGMVSHMRSLMKGGNTGSDINKEPNPLTLNTGDENIFSLDAERKKPKRPRFPSPPSKTKPKRPSVRSSSPPSKTTGKIARATITPVHQFLTNTFIYIRYTREDDESISNSPLFDNDIIRSKRILLTVNQYVIMFLRHLNYVIAAKTNINYQLIDGRQLYIKFPIYVYTNEEAKLHPLDLILKRVESIRSFIENYDFSIDTKSTLWLIRTMTSLGVNLNSDFNITCDCDDFDYQKIDTPLQFKYPPIEYPTIHRMTLSDGSTVIEYEDPYFNDYGVFINLSVPFDEMGMSYNGLHIYEHLMTKGWAELSVNDQIYANGITYPNGICMVYNILSTASAYEMYTNAAFEWLYKIRAENFWNDDISDDVLLETIRTISETRTERTLSSMGRSDLHAYTNSYNRNIFEYWSNKPYTILLTRPKGTKGVNREQLEAMSKKYPLRNVERPDNVKLPFYPLEVMITKQNNKTYILKTDQQRIKEAIMKPKLKTKMYFGVDCYMGQDESPEGNDLSEFNGVLYPLLYNNGMFDDDDLITFVRTHITACSSAMMSNQSMMIRHAADYLEECNLNI